MSTSKIYLGKRVFWQIYVRIYQEQMEFVIASAVGKRALIASFQCRVPDSIVSRQRIYACASPNIDWVRRDAQTGTGRQ